jgi:hypothetical protein
MNVYLKSFRVKIKNITMAGREWVYVKDSYGQL